MKIYHNHQKALNCQMIHYFGDNII